MWKDPIVDEVRKVRAEHAARFDYNLEEIFRDLKEQEQKSGRKVVSLSPKPLADSEAGKTAPAKEER
jgi:hypothetical protein